MTLPRFYPLLDTAILYGRGIDPVTAAEALLEAGARILQLRHKDHWSPEAMANAQTIAEQCRRERCEFIVNDRADVALLLDSSVHVGQHDLPPNYVRKIVGPHKRIGFSTHNEAQLLAAAEEPVNYLALGPIFATTSKLQSDPPIGIEELHRLRPLTNRPLVAIGGITRDNATEVWHAGADSIAVVADLYPAACTKRDIRAIAEEWIQLAHDYTAA